MALFRSIYSTIYHFSHLYSFLFVLTCVTVIGNNCTCKSLEACFIISIYYIEKVFLFVKTFLTISRKKLRKYYFLSMYAWMIYFYMKKFMQKGNFSITFTFLKIDKQYCFNSNAYNGFHSYLNRSPSSLIPNKILILNKLC